MEYVTGKVPFSTAIVTFADDYLEGISCAKELFEYVNNHHTALNIKVISFKKPVTIKGSWLIIKKFEIFLSSLLKSKVNDLETKAQNGVDLDLNFRFTSFMKDLKESGQEYVPLEQRHIDNQASYLSNTKNPECCSCKDSMFDSDASNDSNEEKDIYFQEISQICAGTENQFRHISESNHLDQYKNGKCSAYDGGKKGRVGNVLDNPGHSSWILNMASSRSTSQNPDGQFVYKRNYTDDSNQNVSIPNPVIIHQPSDSIHDNQLLNSNLNAPANLEDIERIFSRIYSDGTVQKYKRKTFWKKEIDHSDNQSETIDDQNDMEGQHSKSVKSSRGERHRYSEIKYPRKVSQELNVPSPVSVPSTSTEKLRPCVRNERERKLDFKLKDQSILPFHEVGISKTSDQIVPLEGTINKSGPNETDLEKADITKFISLDTTLTNSKELDSGVIKNKKTKSDTKKQMKEHCACDHCDFVTSKDSYLKRHIQRAHSKKCYKCTHCSKEFSIIADFNRHIKCHTKAQNCCDVCGKTYKENRKLQAHKKIHSEDYVKPDFPCKFCGKSFSTKYVLAYHIKSEHLGIKKSFVCPICKKIFTQKNSYLQHANIHVGIRPYKCDVCNKSFTYEKSLKEHNFMHREEKLFKCTICSKSFQQASGLAIHCKIHKSSKDYVCSVCGQGFNQKQSLLRHERIHYGQKPYECTLCSKFFSDASVLRRHMILIHKKKASSWREDTTIHPQKPNNPSETVIQDVQIRQLPQSK